MRFETTSTMSNPGEHDGEDLWRFARNQGINRRRFLQLIASGGAAAVIAACYDSLDHGATPKIETDVVENDAPDSELWFKDPEPFIQHSGSLEARLENMQGVITPTRYFFVRNNSESLDIDATQWTLSIEGDAISDPTTLSHDEIHQMPSRTFISYLECAGNQRVMFDRVQGMKAQGTQWGPGAIGNGEWTGVPLRAVLNQAGVSKAAKSVMLVGLDLESPEQGFRRVLPIEKAMHPDTLLAYALNGEALPRDHGSPLRAIVPGWVGSSSIKWLGRIVVSSQQLWTRNNTTSYVLIGEDYPPEGESEGKVVTKQSIKSALALPWPVELQAGEHRIHVFAHSPDGQVSEVEWSEDGGSTWNRADLMEPQLQYSWARFELTFDAMPGEYYLMTRATDSTGGTQPDEIPFNAKGYLFNQPLPHPITVV